MNQDSRRLAFAGAPRQTGLDAAAVGLSAACTIHCLAIPVLAAVLPLFAALESEWIHWAFLAAALPVSALALHRRDTPALFRAGAAIGLAGLLAGALGWPDHDLETPVTVTASIILAATHIANALRIHAARTRDDACSPDSPMTGQILPDTGDHT